jgi:hypothetical protein
MKVFEIRKLLLHGKAPSMGLAISVLLRLTALSGRRLKKPRWGVLAAPLYEHCESLMEDVAIIEAGRAKRDYWFAFWRYRELFQVLRGAVHPSATSKQ